MKKSPGAGGLLACLTVCLTFARIGGAQTVVGIVGDGPQPRPSIPLRLLQQEIDGLISGEFEIALPADKRSDGDWTLEGVRAALEQQLADADVDIVITTGVVASNEAAKIADLAKPVIAAVIADANLQELPVQRMADRVVSGKDNFVYLSRVRLSDDDVITYEETAIDEAIEVFHDTVGFEHLAVLADALTLQSIPQLEADKAPQVRERLGIEITIIPVTESASEALDSLPDSADAVLVGPLLRLGEAGLRELAQSLIGLRLPSFSLVGRSELELGLLMATGGREADAVRYTRRLALHVQSILLGENPATLDVSFVESQRLAINMATASAIGFSPRYAVLADAEQLFGGDLEGGESLSLTQAMAESLDANLALRMAEVDPLIAGEEVNLARSQLRPRLAFGAQGARIDADRANPLFQSERSVDAQLSAEQIIYSDAARADLKIARYLESAARLGYQKQVLDTLQAAASSYLRVLRARALEAVRRANLDVTRTNLELAQLRESIGFSGRGDVLRWESQLATDRQDLIAAEAERRVALTQLNRILNRPQNQNFTASDADVARSIGLFDDDRFQAFIDNAAVWETFQDFAVEQSMAQSPELHQIDELLSAQGRAVLAARRSIYLPELSLGGLRGSNLSRGGAASSAPTLAASDETWSVALNARWPVYFGGALRARVSQEQFVLRRLERERAVVAERLEALTRSALHRASGSYPSVELSFDAARAANENLGLVTDAYSRGAVSVTDLIDAQNTALAAELRAADAQYAYLIDVVDVLRFTADFSLLLDGESTELWFQKVEAYFRGRGIEPRR